MRKITNYKEVDEELAKIDFKGGFTFLGNNNEIHTVRYEFLEGTHIKGWFYGISIPSFKLSTISNGTAETKYKIKILIKKAMEKYGFKSNTK